jgi:catechol 2,3-dioxygenase-like lactoylglutathione lyase family enzyme
VAIIPRTPGIHHIGLRSTDFDVTKNFYRDVIGLALIVDRPDLIVFAAGSVFIVFKKAEPRDKKYSFFSPFEVGLDHIALTCENEDELHRFAKGLADAGIENTGVKMDENLRKLYVAFKDPDRIQWEFYMA